MHSVGSHKKIAKNTYKISNFFFLIRIFMINRENLIKIGRVGMSVYEKIFVY